MFAPVGLRDGPLPVAELAAERAHHRRLHDHPRIQAAYEAQFGRRAGRWLTAASVGIGVLPVRRTRAGRVLAGVLGITGPC